MKLILQAKHWLKIHKWKCTYHKKNEIIKTECDKCNLIRYVFNFPISGVDIVYKLKQ